MFWIYILKCADDRYYTGHTDDLEIHLAQHENKFFSKCYTATRLLIELVYTEYFYTREEAFASEIQIKGWSRRKKEALIGHKLSILAKRKKK